VLLANHPDVKLSVKYAGIKGLDASEDKRKYSTILSFLRTILLKKWYNTEQYDIRGFLSVFNEDSKIEMLTFGGKC